VICNGEEIDSSEGNTRSLVLQDVAPGEYVYQLASVGDGALSNEVSAVVSAPQADDAEVIDAEVIE
jgi:hypothetical protein